MVNVKSRMCEHLGCMHQPSFNVPGNKASRFCSEHKEEGMVNVKYKRCERLGCMKGAHFNVPFCCRI